MRKTPGELFTFLQETLRQSDGVTLRSAMSPDCRSYLVDESWFGSRDRTWSSRGTFALVSDDPDIENSPPVHAVIVPRFELSKLETRSWTALVGDSARIRRQAFRF